MHVTKTVSIHEPDPELYAALARLVKPEKQNSSEWVALKTDDGVSVNVFKPKEAA